MNLLDQALRLQAASIARYDILKEGCPRCDGSGVAESQQSGGHVNYGRCFLCGGAGVVELKRLKKET